VRPVEETEVVSIKDAVAVPLFEVDDGIDPGSLLKQMSAFGMGGWWLGGSHMKPNQQFMSQVQAKIPKDAKVLVTCQKGLR
jgi:rhodanese-related sulfurtransferase